MSFMTCVQNVRSIGRDLLGVSVVCWNLKFQSSLGLDKGMIHSFSVVWGEFWVRLNSYDVLGVDGMIGWGPGGLGWVPGWFQIIFPCFATARSGVWCCSSRTRRISCVRVEGFWTAGNAMKEMRMWRRELGKPTRTRVGGREREEERELGAYLALSLRERGSCLANAKVRGRKASWTRWGYRKCEEGILAAHFFASRMRWRHIWAELKVPKQGFWVHNTQLNWELGRKRFLERFLRGCLG